jgi:hypothetical protein
MVRCGRWGGARAIGDQGVVLAAEERERGGQARGECVAQGRLHLWVTTSNRPRIGRLYGYLVERRF